MSEFDNKLAAEDSRSKPDGRQGPDSNAYQDNEGDVYDPGFYDNPPGYHGGNGAGYRDNGADYRDIEAGEGPGGRAGDRKRFSPRTAIVTKLLLFLLFLSIGYKVWDISGCLKSPDSAPDFSIPLRPYGVHPFKQLVLNQDGIEPKQLEKFEVTYPHVVRPSFGSSLEHRLLLDHEFGNSWGTPAVVDYKAPRDVKFNKVVLTLDTSVGGVQYDRLGHLFLNGVTLWRTSTIEPGGNQAHSNFAKDVSEYLSLFQQDGELSFLLNNIVTHGLDGVFHIKLYVDYYFDESVAQEEAKELTFESLVSSHSPADKIIPLGKGVTDKASPLYYLPSDSYKVELPKLAPNTTELKLSIFASGNGDEEFWYTNVLDRYVSQLSKHLGLLGHGPVRYVEVSLGGEIVASVAPEPVIFSGGFSPALWHPMVSASAFDLRSIDLDLTGLIPLLVSGDNNVLEVRVSTGNIDQDKIGNDWILSGNLHLWENDQVVGSSGHTGSFDHKEKKDVLFFGIGGIEQVIDVKRSSSITGQIEFELKHGSPVSGLVEYDVDSKVSNVQFIPRGDTNQELTHDSKTSKALRVKVQDESGDYKVVKRVATTTEYPLVLNLNVYNDNGISYKVEIVNGKSIKVGTADLASGYGTVLKLDSFQNGSSMFYLSPSGNHGFGKLRSDYLLETSDPMPDPIEYHRKIEYANSSLVFDHICDNIDDPSVKCETHFH